MNNKIVSVVLVAGIAATGFAGISAANESSKTSFFKGNSEIKELFEKVRSGEDLTADEQAALDEAKASKGERGEKGAKHGGKRKGGGNLTDEEKATLETLSDEEKKEFFDAKKEEMKAEKEAAKSVIEKLINRETLSADEQALRGELLNKIELKTSDDTEGKAGKHGKGSSDLFAKILAGDELTTEQQAELAAMQEKKAEREAQKAILEPIKAKLDAGEELTSEEQVILDEAKASKGEGKKGGKAGKGEKNGEKKGNKGERTGERADKGE